MRTETRAGRRIRFALGALLLALGAGVSISFWLVGSGEGDGKPVSSPPAGAPIPAPVDPDGAARRALEAVHDAARREKKTIGRIDGVTRVLTDEEAAWLQRRAAILQEARNVANAYLDLCVARQEKFPEKSVLHREKWLARTKEQAVRLFKERKIPQEEVRKEFEGYIASSIRNVEAQAHLREVVDAAGS